MVSLDQNDKVIPIYLKDVEDENGKIRPRLVDMENEDVKSVFETNVYYLKEEDYEAAKKFVANPAEFDYYKILNW